MEAELILGWFRRRLTRLRILLAGFEERSQETLDRVNSSQKSIDEVRRELASLTSSSHEHSVSSHEHSVLLAKIVLNQNEMSQSLRELGSLPNAAPAPKTSSAGCSDAQDGATVPLREADIESALLQTPAFRDLVAGRGDFRLVKPAILPKSSRTLPRLLEIMTACRNSLRHPEKLVWLQPLAPNMDLSAAEMEQVLGLVAAVDKIEEVTDGEQTYRLGIGAVRLEAMGFAVRWSVAAMQDLHTGSPALMLAAMREAGLDRSLHAVDLPASAAEQDAWAQLLPSIADLLSGLGDVPVGVVLPPNFDGHSAVTSEHLDLLVAALKARGLTGTISFQWMRGVVAIERSAAVVEFATKHAIEFDLTAVNRGCPENRLSAYDDLCPYRPMPFDLRLPSFAPRATGLIEIPRWPVRSALNTLYENREAFRGLASLFDRDFERARIRLAPVLDRIVQSQFERQANLDTTMVPNWPEYFVYNWSPPRPVAMRIFEIAADELGTPGSPLTRLHRDGLLSGEDPRVQSGRALLDAALTAVQGLCLSGSDLRAEQITEHLYLRDHDSLTADTARLIEWMPASLGDTLEIGSGYGIMARRIRHRARRYVACDLTVQQALALRALGAEAFVGDIHRFPLPDRSIDSIVADNVVEHAYDPLAVLRECRRILRPGGSAYLIIPNDYRGASHRNRAHYWKADEASVRVALAITGFRLVRNETLWLSELGMTGAFPSSGGTTGLWHIQAEDDAPDGQTFDLEGSRKYWRLVPSGLGKHDSAELLDLADGDLEEVWDKAFMGRLRQYPEEELFVRGMSLEFAGKRVLSIGSGLGFHELYYASQGADVTCCDIVQSNLDIVGRIAAIKSIAAVEFILSEGPRKGLVGPYDVIFLYGSLMTMPEPLQKRLIQQCMAVLGSSGRVVLMLYTWEFARRMCGWSSAAQFDPQVFARASDPSVGDEHCPWSDWHDDEKLLALFTGGVHITRRQFWNQQLFVWYEVARGQEPASVTQFFDPDLLTSGTVAEVFDIGRLAVAESSIEQADGRIDVETGVNNSAYALISESMNRSEAMTSVNAIVVDADLELGAFSVGILDDRSNSFAFAQAISEPGRRTHVFSVPQIPARFRTIISNHRSGEAGASLFSLYGIEFLVRPSLVSPMKSNRNAGQATERPSGDGGR